MVRLHGLLLMFQRGRSTRIQRKSDSTEFRPSSSVDDRSGRFGHPTTCTYRKHYKRALSGPW